MEKEFKDYKYLGWTNPYNNGFSEVDNCIKSGHKVMNKYDPKGFENFHWCPICKYYFNSDSSD